MQIGIGIATTICKTAYAPPFSPASISGLRLWLDASDETTLFQNSNGTTAASADGDPVGYWGDKSGNLNHCVQADGTKKPLLRTSIQNSKNVVRNDGVNDFLKSTTGGEDGSYTLIVVNVKRGGQGTQMMAFSTGEEATGKRRCMWHRGDNNTISFNGYSRDSLTALTWETNIPNVAQIKNNLTQPYFAKNGGSWITGSANVTLVTHAATSIYVASNNQNTEIFNADYCEVLYYSGLMADSDRALLLAYLNAKWSIY